MAIKPVKVSQLNSYIKRILQADPLLGNVSVIGEISNLKYHGSGHIYFSLKDETSKINCFLAAENLVNIRYELEDGMEVTLSGYIYLYERGGSYSLNVRDIVVEGVGNLSAAFEKLKLKLSKEGLFDEKHKKDIPFFPLKIAVITSETGAAVRDIVKVIKNKNNIVDILIYPCLVQGPNAAAEIAHAIDEVNRLFPDIDTIIVGRGGGSMEELWAFNEEIVARSIFASVIHVISAVGHETDFTIADFVADKRAETPTAAAQMAVPDVQALREELSERKKYLNHMMSSFLNHAQLKIKSNDITNLQQALRNRIQMLHMKVEALRSGIEHSMNQQLTSHTNQLERLMADISALNPKNIMERGYAAILDGDGLLTGTAKKFEAGDSLTVIFKDGQAHCEVQEVRGETNV
jgi:exodeoxyribonuclease VII large subunit